MKPERIGIWTQRLVIIALIFVLLYVVYLLQPVWMPVLGMAWRVLFPFLTAAIIAYLLHPLIDVLHKWHVPRPLAILSVYIFFFGGGSWLIWYYSPVVVQELQRFIQSLPFYIDQTYEWMTKFHRRVDMLPSGVHDHIELSFRETEKRAAETLRGLAGRWKDLLDAAVTLILLPFLVFYLLKDYRAFQKLVKRYTPRKWQDEAHLLAVSIDEALGSYIRGQFIVAGTVGLLSTVALFWMDIPSALILGLFIGLTDIIPYFGPILGAVPAVIAAGTVSMSKAVLTGAVLFVIQQVEGNLLSPYIVGRNVHMHPLMIVFALLLGFETAGVIGLLLAVPLFVVVHHVIRTFHSYKNGRENED
ncbi:AI-2E family transporter [Salibacterium lacus]|uniref:AI-2E family transporter n=1 Tax=Salibacterium lacus TaxID=1898109 RepID=A0ABW5SXZ1_9BACI